MRGPIHAKIVPVPVEYKGIHYWVVLTANPVGWKWIVHLNAKRSKSGEAPDRRSGVIRAKAAIDQAIQRGRVKDEK